jgi:hypothetical protein
VRYDFEAIDILRRAGTPWPKIAEMYDAKADTIRGAFSRWRNLDQPSDDRGHKVLMDYDPASDELDPVLLSRDDISRITNLEELVEFFEVDTEKWQVDTFRINKWESASVKNGIVPLYQVRATLGRNKERDAEIAAQVYNEALADLRAHRRVPSSFGPGHQLRPHIPKDGEPHLLEVAVFDPHIGMYGWAQEVGEDYDSGIGVRRYLQVVEQALSVAQFYPVDRVLYVVGNDLSHVDALGVQQKGGTTTAGTAQDFDSRLPKVFAAIRRAVVAGIDMARAVGPVDVLVIPGNHDEQTTYKLGEVLQAWYRNDPLVDVKYDVESDDEAYWPRRRQYYQYGHNGFMFTHGMEYKRKRDPLPLLFATEAPPMLWATTTHREVHTGHNHIRMSGRYQPEQDVTETRAIITRSLPGLTPEDAWHYQQGYKHSQAGTALVYRRSGGIAGLHEFTPEV